jgi:hypothetical protein
MASIMNHASVPHQAHPSTHRKVITMKVRVLLSIGLIAGAAGQAFAQDAASRTQMRADVDEARRAGELIAPGEAGLTERQLRPDLYPSVAQQPAKPRQETRAELQEALRTGEIYAGGESSFKRNELDPNRYPRVAVAPGKSREEAKAELAEAVRTGDIVAGGELAAKENQLYPNQYREGHRAVAGINWHGLFSQRN